MLFSLCFSFTFAQRYEYDDAVIEVKEEPKSDVPKNRIYILLKITDINYDIPVKKASIITSKKDTNSPYSSNEEGELEIITKKSNLKIDIIPQEEKYSKIQLAGLKLKKGKHYSIRVYLTPKQQITPKPIEEHPSVRKPVIYLYPSVPTELDIKLQIQGELTFSYPKYQEGWKCTALPNGDIKIGEKTYPYLFWEGKLNPIDPEIQESGFVVKSENIVSFLEEKLAHIGLNDKEMTDFITFWAPRLEQNAYSYLHFSIGEEYAKNIATLDLNTQPDAELHVNLFYAPVGPDFKVQSQELPTFERKGFTLVEWGGGPIELNNDN